MYLMLIKIGDSVKNKFFTQQICAYSPKCAACGQEWRYYGRNISTKFTYMEI